MILSYIIVFIAGLFAGIWAEETFIEYADNKQKDNQAECEEGQEQWRRWQAVEILFVESMEETAWGLFQSESALPKLFAERYRQIRCRGTSQADMGYSADAWRQMEPVPELGKPDDALHVMSRAIPQVREET